MSSQLSDLEQQVVPFQTSIAVVGDTGAGKSSLLNALVEEEEVLPTSSMKACTSVVVQVSQNSENEHYEADVEFFTEEEWDKELTTLIKDMKEECDNFKKFTPDPETEAAVAYSRVMAVYGKIAEFHELKQIQEVTRHLGTVKHISEKQPEDHAVDKPDEHVVDKPEDHAVDKPEDHAVDKPDEHAVDKLEEHDHI
ncbi:nuclear GTPase SLIP-GC-like [Latimeria chalumnae]|uniref:nuclear GTPase SLIP-GC-like n=1 Tax=Latimeria chalumnae TaxID=7897 RepID=UPI00313F19DE